MASQIETMKAKRPTLTVHGRKASSPFSERDIDGGCRPECPSCGTGTVCARDTDAHYCAYAECVMSDRGRFMSEYPR